jgi:hypothetical protein
MTDSRRRLKKTEATELTDAELEKVKGGLDINHIVPVPPDRKKITGNLHFPGLDADE